MIRTALTAILFLMCFSSAHAQSSPNWQSRTSNTACVGLSAATKPGCQPILAAQFNAAFAGKLDVNNPDYLASQSKVAALGSNQVPLQPNVFVGAVANPGNLAIAAAVAKLTASGRIGIYWHFSGLFSMIQGGGVDQAASAIWNPLGNGVGEMPYSTGIPASDTVIAVSNSSAAAVNLQAGALVSDTGGGSWAVVYPNLLVALDNRPQSCMDPVNQTYTIPAGGSCLIDVQSAVIGPTTISANAITTFSPAISGLSITASDAVVSSGSSQTAGVNYGRVGSTPDNTFYTRTDGGGFTSLLTGRGHPVTEEDINIDYQTSHTAQDVATWKAYVDAARAVGLQNVAPIVQPDQSYANASGGGNFTNAFNSTYRQMALYGGGIAFDEPPRHSLSYGYGYVQWMESAILWARANNLRSSWIISPDDYAQGSFIEDLHSLVSVLRHDDALPTQWIVENYRTQCGATTIGNDTTHAAQTTAVSSTCPSGAPAVPYSESLNAAALYLANTVGAAPSAAIESNLITSTPVLQAAYHPAGHAGWQINPSDLFGGSHLLTDAAIGARFGVLGLDWLGNIPGGVTVAAPTTLGFPTAGINLSISGPAAVALDLSGSTASQAVVRLPSAGSITWLGSGSSPLNSTLSANNGQFSFYQGSMLTLLIDPAGSLYPAGTVNASHGLQFPLVGAAPTSYPAKPAGGVVDAVVDGVDSKVCFYISSAWKCATLQ